MLLLAIPLCLNAQVKPQKPNQKPKQDLEQPKPIQPTDEKASMSPNVKPGVKPNAIKPGNPRKTEDPKMGKSPEKDKKGPKPEKPKKPEKPEKPDSKESKGGIELPRISGFVQGMYQADVNGNGELNNTFRMRRVRLSVDGTLFKDLTYKIQGDFVRSPMLVDAYLKYKVCNEFAIQIGQFKTPFSLESPINPVNLEIFDYGEGIQKLVGYSDVCGVGALGRDLGIMATGSLFPMKNDKGAYNIVDYAVGVFNGNGANVLDNNNRKDVVGRLEVHPGLKDLTVSGSFYVGKYKKDDANQGRRNRWSVGAQYNNGDFVVRAEYLNGTTGRMVDITDTIGNVIATEELYRFSKGYYAVAGYNFKLGKDKSQKLMPVLRYEHFEPGDMDPIVYGSTNYYTVGLNYWPIKSVNFKLDYSLVQQVIGERTNSHRIVGILSYKF